MTPRNSVALALLAAVIALGVTVRRRVVAVTVRGTSMTPTFRDGERVHAIRRANYRVGEVIVFDAHTPAPRWRIKRVAATAGDPVPDWLPRHGRIVPAGHLVVVGDNPTSQDSRQLGFIADRDILGRVHTARTTDVQVGR